LPVYEITSLGMAIHACIARRIATNFAKLPDVHAKAVRALLDGRETSGLNLGAGRGWSVNSPPASAIGCYVHLLVGARRGNPVIRRF